MSLKDNFQQQDWRTLQFSFLWTFDAVAGIDGESDDKEQQTMQQVLAEAHHHPLAIFSEVLVSLESSFHSLHQDFPARSSQHRRRPAAGHGDPASASFPCRGGGLPGGAAAVWTAGWPVLGGILGLGSKVSRAERRCLQRLEKLLAG